MHSSKSQAELDNFENFRFSLKSSYIWNSPTILVSDPRFLIPKGFPVVKDSARTFFSLPSFLRTKIISKLLATAEQSGGEIFSKSTLL